MANRDYQFIESTTSLCPACMKRLDAKIVLKGGSIYLLKHCLEHGAQEELLEEDGRYYMNRLAYDKPGTISKTQTERKNNCPFDCGLCPEHDQHTCIGLIEVTQKCDQQCPVCYAGSGGEGDYLPLEKIDGMIEFFRASEYGKAEILQLSGGEPTLHPGIIDIIKLARSKVKYVFLNTNGLRLAEDEKFAAELGQFQGGFEVYLQFDGFDGKTHERLRGRDLSEVKQKALANLAKYKVPVTLVATVVKGVNDGELGRMVEFGLNADNIRGINFQPVAFWGRLGDVDKKDRLTITGIIGLLEKQTKGMLEKSDFIPLPCDVDRVALTYLYRTGGGFIPLIRDLDIKDYLPVLRNTFNFDPEDIMRDLDNSAAGVCGPSCSCKVDLMKNFKKIIPAGYLLKSEKKKVEYVSANTFRISVTSFVDAHNFDLKAMKKECVHVITPDLKKIPFSAYNMLYRKK